MHNIFKVLKLIKSRVFAAPLIFCMFSLACSASHAQTATVTAVNDLSCIGDRIGRKGICTANEFTSVLTFSQSATNTLTTCLAGSDVLVDVIADICQLVKTKVMEKSVRVQLYWLAKNRLILF